MGSGATPQTGPRRRPRRAVRPSAEIVAAALPSPDVTLPAPPVMSPLRLNTVGAIDGLIGTSVFGWAYDRDFGRRRVKIAVHIDGKRVAETMANGLRRELAGIGSHDGFSGFACAIPPEKFVPGATIRVFADGTELGAGPLVLGPQEIDGVLEPLTGPAATGWVRERVLAPTRAVLDMYVDGHPVRTATADRLRPELKRHGVADGCFGFAEALPESCLDGSEHRVEFRHRASGTVIAPGARCFTASFVGALEQLNEHGGAGWLFCREAPTRPVNLDIVVNGETIPVVADRSRGDVRAVHGVESCGFEFHIPETVSRHREFAVEVRIAGTRNAALPGPFSFTPMSRVIEALEGVAAGAPEHSQIRETIVPALLAALRAHGRPSGPFDLSLRLDLAQFHKPVTPVVDTVDIVIPVYAGHDETVACIDSVIRATNKTRC